jgi:hypothetical protein
MEEIRASFYIKEYLNLKNKKLSKGISFLLFFTFLISFIFAFKSTLFVNRGLPNLAYKAKQILKNDIASMPKIEVKDGVTIRPEKRYSKYWKEHLFIIDSNEKDPYKILEEPKLFLGLTKNHLVIKRDKGEVESDIKVYSIEKIKELFIVPTDKGFKMAIGNFNLDITSDSIDKITKRFSVIAFPFFLVLFLIFLFPSKMTQVLFFSILSIILNDKLKTNLKYKELLNISIYAVIPPTILSMILMLLNLRLPFFWIIYLTIYITFIYRAIKTCSLNSTNSIVVD